MVMALVILVVLGLALGSFVNAFVWRINKKKDWVKARSQCPKCRHELAAADLIPIVSWLLLNGHCRYCKKPISAQYPLVELAMAASFAASYYFWPGGVENTEDWVLLTTWLATSVGLMALLVYDARWMLLPNKILYPTAAIAAAGQLVYLIGFAPDKLEHAILWITSVAVASGIFGLIYLISKGKWIGFGDVRLGLVTGTVLASPALAVLMIVLASFLGVIFALPSLAKGDKTLASKLPFGPFLIAATFFCLLFGDSIVDWYKGILLP